MMDVQQFSLQIVYCATIGLNVLWSTLSMELTGSKTNIFEYTEFTLRCSNNGNTLGDIKWMKTNPNQTAAMSAEQSIFPVTSLTLSPNSLVLTGSENSTISLTCTTSECKPEPRFLWYKNDSPMTERDGILSSHTVAGGNTVSEIQPYTNTLTLKLSRELNEWYLLCDADNQNGNPVSSRKIRLNVTYPPFRSPSISSISNTDEIKVFKNDHVHLGCSVTGGNPLPSLEWNKNGDSPMIISGNTVSKDISWIATELTPVELICQSIHPYGNKTAYITINILYPPDKPQVMIRTSSDVYLEVNGMFSVIENTPFTLNCSARSNPPVSMFKWNALSPTHVSFLYNMNVDRHHSKPITCEVSNVMKTSDSRPTQTGKNITQVVVNVLYPSTVNKMPNRTAYEGDDVFYRCSFEPGNPSVTNVTWSWNGTTWNDSLLTIINVSRHNKGVYRCDVQNFMVSSDGTKAFGNASGEFYLSVQSAKIASFSPPSSKVSVVAGVAAGTVGGVLFLAALIIVLIFYRKRKHLSYQKREVSIQYYNCNDSNVNECISTNADNVNAYEAFQHTGSDKQYDSLSPENSKTEKENDCQISAEGGYLHVYEGLQTKGIDQQYETISPSTCKVIIEHHTVYENLQL